MVKELSTKQILWLWIGTSGSLGACLVVGAELLATSSTVHSHPSALAVARVEGLALLILCLAVGILASLGALRLSESPGALRVKKHPYVTLFLISFVCLFVELLLIRYANSQIRIFSFYKNVPLIGAFLGLGLGCWLARGRQREVILFLAWLVPVATFLTGGALLLSNVLGRMAAIGSAEHILGDYVPTDADRARQLVDQLVIAGFCVATLVVITLIFSLAGRLLGSAFEGQPRLPAYTVNICGSLAGILGFSAVSLLEWPPWTWFIVGLTPLVWWLTSLREIGTGVVLVSLSAAAVAPTYGDTVWSRYQKLVGHSQADGTYRIEISDVFYQVALDRSPAAIRRLGGDPFPHYGAPWLLAKEPGRVLVVGAGTGNDVAAALRAGATHVDAVDIDPAIVDMGRRHHPERPYDDPRVRVIIDDARHAFRNLPEASYDVVLFGLLDSHTQLGVSSLRLDNYVFTRESFEEAARLLRPGGYLSVTAAVFTPWFHDRLHDMVKATVGGKVSEMRTSGYSTFIGQVDQNTRVKQENPNSLPTDDWPFLYLPRRSIPLAYLWVVGAMALASIIVLRVAGLQKEKFSPYYRHMFFLGAAFLLMEVHAINRLALFFGTTWIVSAVTIALVLSLIVLANVLTMALGRVSYAMSYGGLALSLTASFLLEPSSFLGYGTTAGVVFGTVLVSPVFFAGLVFSRSFAMARAAGPAIGANILGSVLGGWIEYGTMAVGMRALVLLAAVFYALSLLYLLRHRRLGESTERTLPAPIGQLTHDE